MTSNLSRPIYEVICTQGARRKNKFLEFMSGLGLKDQLTFDGWMSFLDS